MAQISERSISKEEWENEERDLRLRNLCSCGSSWLSSPPRLKREIKLACSIEKMMESLLFDQCRLNR